MLKDLINKVKSNEGNAQADASTGQPQPPAQPPASNQPAQPEKPAEGNPPDQEPAEGQQPAQPEQKPVEDPASEGQQPAAPATGEAPKPPEGSPEQKEMNKEAPKPDQVPGGQPAEGKPTEQPGQKPAEGQPTEGQPAATGEQSEQKPAEGQPTQGQPGAPGEKPAEGKAAPEQATPAPPTTRDSPLMKTISRESASMLNLLMEQIKALVEVGNNLNERTKESEKRINEITVESERFKEHLKSFQEKMEIMEKNMEKFIGLYEVVTNQYNPFLEASGKTELAEDNKEGEEGAEEMPEPEMPAEQPGNNVVVEDKITGQQTQVGAQQQSDAQPSNESQNPQQPNAQQNPQTAAPNPNAPPHEKEVSQAFALSNGKSVSNLQDLFEELVYMDDATFRNHVNDTKHEIADWVTNALQNPDLAASLKELKTRSGLIKGISEFIHKQPPEEPSSKDLKLPNGKTVNDIEGLLDEIIYMDDGQFATLVNPQQNQIADWIGNTLQNQDLAAKVKAQTAKPGLVKELINFLHTQNK